MNPNLMQRAEEWYGFLKTVEPRAKPAYEYIAQTINPTRSADSQPFEGKGRVAQFVRSIKDAGTVAFIVHSLREGKTRSTVQYLNQLAARVGIRQFSRREVQDYADQLGGNVRLQTGRYVPLKSEVQTPAGKMYYATLLNRLRASPHWKEFERILWADEVQIAKLPVQLFSRGVAPSRLSNRAKAFLWLAEVYEVCHDPK